MHSAVMSAGARNKDHSNLTMHWSQTDRPSTKFLQLAQLRKLRECEQVAAVCYRVRNTRIEFLLVQTRGGRWTFPKGHSEPGLTHAQAAALEAFEEAGVHGRMEEASFMRYFRRERGAVKSREKDLAVNAHLCLVKRLESPREANRNPTWFSAAKAKRRLREARPPEYADELARVVDRAVARIQHFNSTSSAQHEPQLQKTEKDALQKVHFTIENPKPTRALPRSSAFRRNRKKVIQIDQF